MPLIVHIACVATRVCELECAGEEKVNPRGRQRKKSRTPRGEIKLKSYIEV